MTEDKPARSAIVADRRSLERGLARVLLEERGFTVAEVTTMADVLLHVQRSLPDVVVLHSRIALDHDPSVIAQIRRMASRTHIVLLAPSREDVPLDLTFIADVIVDDGPGLTELPDAVVGLTRTASEKIEEPAPVTDIDDRGHRPVELGRRWADRLQGMAVASVIALAIVIGRGFIAEPTLAPTPQAQVHLAAAWQSLEDLEDALASETPTEIEIADIASTLVAERAAAEEAGADLVDLDQAVQSAVTDVWGSLSPETQGFVAALLEDVFVDNGEEPPSLEAPAQSTTSEPPSQDDSDPPPAQTTTQPPDPATEPPPAQGPPPGQGPPPEPEPSTGPPPTEPPVSTTTEPPPTITTEPPPTTTTEPPPTTTPTPTLPTTTMTTLTLTTTATPTSGTPTTLTTTAIGTTTATPTTTITITTSAPPPTTSVPPTTTAPPTSTSAPPTTTSLPPTSSAPSSTVQPVPGETRSASFAALPFGLLFMTAASGWLRHRARRSGDDDGSSPGAS